MPRLIITDGAANDLQRCRDFLVEKAPQIAERVGETILGRLLSLTITPHMGRPVPTFTAIGQRELSIPFGDSGYVALYRFEPNADAVFVLAIRHQRESGYP